jgi:hypothetical protein
MQDQPKPEHGREPCPDRILDDIGGAFGMGALGGGLWHTYRGLKNSPKGYKIVGTIDVSGSRARLGCVVLLLLLLHCTPCGTLCVKPAPPATQPQFGARAAAGCCKPTHNRRFGASRHGWAATLPTGASCSPCLTAPASTSAKRCVLVCAGTERARAALRRAALTHPLLPHTPFNRRTHLTPSWLAR